MTSNKKLLPFSLPTFKVTFYSEEEGQVMIDVVKAFDFYSAMGVASTERGDFNPETGEYEIGDDIVLISATDENGEIECPGVCGSYISDILEQELFSSGITSTAMELLNGHLNKQLELLSLKDAADVVDHGIASLIYRALKEAADKDQGRDMQLVMSESKFKDMFGLLCEWLEGEQFD